MDIEQWWPNLKPSTREWLIENNGDEVPAEVAAEISEAGGMLADPSESSGFQLSDDATDWIEAVANGEEPAPKTH
jgi:hypothetical protein